MGQDEYYLFDFKYWSAFQACKMAAIWPGDTIEQIEKLEKELQSHRNKKANNALSFMVASAIEENKDDRFIEKNIVFNRFLKICNLYSSYFDLDNPITPKQFIDWAIQRDSFKLPPRLLEWHRHRKERIKNNFGRTSISENKKIIQLEAELAACREHLAGAQAARTPDNADIEDFFDTYPICKLIHDLHHAGKNQDEIRAALKEKGYTSAQTGFITQEDTIPRTDDTTKKSVKRSLKNIKS